MSLKKFVFILLFSMLSLSQALLGLTLNDKLVEFHEINESYKIVRDVRDVDNKKILLLKTNSPLTTEEKNSSKEFGIESIEYAGDISYYIYGDEEAINSFISDLDENNSSKEPLVAEVELEHKISEESLVKQQEDISANETKEYNTLNILLMKEFSEFSLEEYFNENNIDANISYIDEELKQAKIDVFKNDFYKLLNLSAISYVEYGLLTLSENDKIIRNLVTANAINSSQLWSDPYNLSGYGIDAAVVDAGQVRVTHQEFDNNGTSRVTVMGNNDNVSNHATHVGGTIGAQGINPDARGMANHVSIYSYYYNDVYFSRAISKAYQDANILLSNHSYNYSEAVFLGKYSIEAQSQDRYIYQNPYINSFIAAGNDRGDSNYPEYGIIKGPANSKNVLTIGALNETSDEIAAYSSIGPVYDGRIKPDLCVRGSGVLSASSSSDNSYTIKYGTSMATPAATGVGALIMEQYKNETNSTIRHDILKSVLVNTAQDIGRDGPDYESGFGMINAHAAIEALKSINSAKPLLHTGEIQQDETLSFDFVLQSYEESIKITISWVDMQGNPNSEKSLVNDIDMWLVNNTTGETIYPYSLNKNNPTDLAINYSFNRVDNIEQIYIQNSDLNNYTLFIKGYLIISDSQPFAIVASKSIYENSLANEFVKNLYRTILSRSETSITSDEIEYWVQKLEDGDTALFVIENFLNSMEFDTLSASSLEYATKLYQVFLGREPDSEGLEYWIDTLDNRGSSKDLLKYGFAFSEEFEGICESYEINSSMQSDQLKAFIERMYVYVLYRDSDGGGMDYWVEELSSYSKKGSDIVKDFYNSQEFLDNNITNEQFVTTAYRSILGREPEADGYNYWVNRINETSNYDEIINLFLESDEFLQIANQYGIEAN